MCKVYEFPVKKDIPEDIIEKLEKAARDYVKIINESLESIVDYDTTEEEYNELTGKLLEQYVNAIVKAVDEYE